MTDRGFFRRKWRRRDKGHLTSGRHSPAYIMTADRIVIWDPVINAPGRTIGRYECGCDSPDLITIDEELLDVSFDVSGDMVLPITKPLP
jgi:hypothetical protein